MYCSRNDLTPVLDYKELHEPFEVHSVFTTHFLDGVPDSFGGFLQIKVISRCCM